MVVIQPCANNKTTLGFLPSLPDILQTILVYPNLRVPNFFLTLEWLWYNLVPTLYHHCSARVWDAVQGRGWGSVLL